MSFVAPKSISYTRFSRARGCLLRGFRSTAEKCASSIKSRRQFFGLVGHKLFEKYLQQDGFDPETALVRSIHDVMDVNHFSDRASFSVSEIRRWPEWALLVQGFVDFRASSLGKEAREGEIILLEDSIKSKNKRVSGVIDLCFRSSNGLHLIDYKFGLRDADQVAQSYSDQLNLYGYLIQENFGESPLHSFTIDTSGLAKKQAVSETAGKTIAFEMEAVLGLLERFSGGQVIPDYFVRPSSDNCSYCDRKPGCPAYLSRANEIHLPLGEDLAIGIQMGNLMVSKDQSHSLVLEVIEGSLPKTKVQIFSLPGRIAREIDDLPGQRLVLTNLIKDWGQGAPFWRAGVFTEVKAIRGTL